MEARSGEPWAQRTELEVLGARAALHLRRHASQRLPQRRHLHRQRRGELDHSTAH